MEQPPSHDLGTRDYKTLILPIKLWLRSRGWARTNDPGVMDVEVCLAQTSLCYPVKVYPSIECFTFKLFYEVPRLTAWPHDYIMHNLSATLVRWISPPRVALSP